MRLYGLIVNLSVPNRDILRESKGPNKTMQKTSLIGSMGHSMLFQHRFAKLSFQFSESILVNHAIKVSVCFIKLE